MRPKITLKDICREIGHDWKPDGQHEVGGVPSHYQHDMGAVTRGSITYLDYKCRSCGATISEEKPYSWRQTPARKVAS